MSRDRHILNHQVASFVMLDILQIIQNATKATSNLYPTYTNLHTKYEVNQSIGSQDNCNEILSDKQIL